MKFKYIILMTMVLIAILTPGAAAQENDTGGPENQTFDELYVKGKVLEIENLDKQDYGEGQYFQEQLVTVKIIEGDDKGKVVVARNTLSGSPGWDIEVNPGDKVLLYITSSGGVINEVYVSDIARIDPVFYLVIAFMVILILVGGIKGMKSLVALGLTVFVVYKVLLPGIMDGKSPIMLTVILMIGVTFFTMFVVGGFNRKSLSATLGTAAGVLIAGIIALVIGDIAHLTGFATEESRMLLYVDGLDFDMQGLLFAGIIIGALGATMDVAMSIASAIDEIKRANPVMQTGELFRSGMNVGKDIMGTMANTLILAYTGSALPLLLLYMAYETSATRILSSEIIATEVVRAMAGSIGLIFAVPLTAILASLLAAGTRKELDERL